MSFGGSQVWSEWTWSATWNCWERARWENGGWKYEYDTTPAPAAYNTPRMADTSTMLSSLTPQMGGMSLGPSSSMGSAGPSKPAYYPPTGMARGTSSNTTNITTRNSHVKVDELDKRFKQHRSKDFRFGSIFKVVWSEPTGTYGTEITVDALYDQKAHKKIRRFIVVDTRKGHSICLPIFTYGGQGTFKPGCHPDDHAVVYSSRKPYYIDNESKQITKRSIKCIMDGPEHKLDPTSRLNYAKLYTVEHNVKVWFVGQVAADYEQKVVVDYNLTHPGLEDRPGASEASSADLTRNADGGDSSYSLHATPQTDGPQYGSTANTSVPAGNFDPAISSHGEQFGTAQSLDGYIDGQKPY